MLIITYTSSHNHPGPDLSTTPTTPSQEKKPHEQAIEETPTTPKEDHQPEPEPEAQEQPITMASAEDASTEDQFHYFQSTINHEEEDPFRVNLEKTHDSLGVLFDEEPLAYPHLMTFSTPKSEENDFFDELEELPTSSSFTSFMRSGFNFFDDRILVHPS